MDIEPASLIDLESDLEAAEDEATLAAVQHGEFVEHASVRDWLLSKATASPKPRPEPRR